MYWTKRVSSCNRILILSGDEEALLSIFSATKVSITRSPAHGRLDPLRVVFMLAVSSEYFASALSTLVVVCDDRVKIFHGQLYPRSAKGPQPQVRSAYDLTWQVNALPNLVESRLCNFNFTSPGLQRCCGAKAISILQSGYSNRC